MIERWLPGKQFRPIEKRITEQHQMRPEAVVERTAEGILPTEYGLWNIVSYNEKETNEEHVVIYKGDITTDDPLLTRMHSSCVTAETFHATNCDCHEQMEKAMELIADEGRGLILWLRQEGRGNGLAGKVLQLGIMMEQNTNTVEAFELGGMPGEARNYQAAVDIYRDLGVKAKLRMLTHNPNKIKLFQETGFEAELVPFEVKINSEITRRDIEAKISRLGHIY